MRQYSLAWFTIWGGNLAAHRARDVMVKTKTESGIGQHCFTIKFVYYLVTANHQDEFSSTTMAWVAISETPIHDIYAFNELTSQTTIVELTALLVTKIFFATSKALNDDNGFFKIRCPDVLTPFELFTARQFRHPYSLPIYRAMRTSHLKCNFVRSENWQLLNQTYSKAQLYFYFKQVSITKAEIIRPVDKSHVKIEHIRCYRRIYD